MKAIIVVNAFLKPGSSIRQAKRLQQELNSRNIKCEIVSNGLNNLSLFKSANFVIYLDKDKYLSQLLQNSGYRLFNMHDAIRVCDDKGETCIALQKNNIRIPKTLFAPVCYDSQEIITNEQVNTITNELNFPIVVKESYGSMGKGVYLAKNENELKNLMEKLKTIPHIYQEFIGEGGVDTRVIVIGGKVFTAMKRVNTNDFRSNIAQGGHGENVILTKEQIEIAQNCAKVLKLDYCGVDILTGLDGKPYICEVNSNAFFEGIEKVTGNNVAKNYVDYILKNFDKNP